MSKQKTKPTKKIMKLAEALLLRSDLMKKVETLLSRIKPVLIVAEGYLPQEDPKVLLAQLRKVIQDIESLVVRINRTNNSTNIEGEGALMEALAKRDSLKMLSENLRRVREQARIYNTGDNRLEAMVNIKDLQIEMDQTGRSFREIDSKIQEMNWLTELKE